MLLRSPLHRVASGQLLLITYTGRRSGRSYTLPVMYARHEDALVVHVARADEKVWWRNLRGGAAVRIRLRGRTLGGRAEVVQGNLELAQAYVERFPRERERLEASADPVFVVITSLEPAV